MMVSAVVGGDFRDVFQPGFGCSVMDSSAAMLDKPAPRRSNDTGY
jgi:hypothetical protein